MAFFQNIHKLYDLNTNCHILQENMKPLKFYRIFNEYYLVQPPTVQDNSTGTRPSVRHLVIFPINQPHRTKQLLTNFLASLPQHASGSHQRNYHYGDQKDEPTIFECLDRTLNLVTNDNDNEKFVNFLYIFLDTIANSSTETNIHDLIEQYEKFTQVKRLVIKLYKYLNP